VRLKPWIRLVAVLVLAAELCTVAPVPARADDVPTAQDSAAGAVGAVVCGAGSWLIRTNPATGMNPYVLSATIAGCLLMFIDCF
jgi:hypothetical protein